MIDKKVQQELIEIWDSYTRMGEKTFDTKGREFDNINRDRIIAIEDIKKILFAFLSDKLDLPEFKTNLDSYNKQNNFWGFTAAKGQMFFNLLTKSSSDDINVFIKLLKGVITEPLTLDEALKKIELLSSYASSFQEKATDKRYVANPKSSAYFLSYFWQIFNNEKWPIMYSSLIVSYEKLGIWNSFPTAAENYQQFFHLNEEIKKILSVYAKRKVTNWDIEHALWNFSGTTAINTKAVPPKKAKTAVGSTISPPGFSIKAELPADRSAMPISAGFELNEYLIPRIARLEEVGLSTEKSTGTKGREFEKLVGEAFTFLDFEVEILGQGSGREPDAIAKFRTDHIAFIIDAKAYSSGYSLGTDDRAIREYINNYCPKLKKEGFTKIGFIIVSNSFKSDLQDLINDITWNTDIKRFMLLTTKALQYLVAYKAKERLSVPQIIEKLITFDNPISDGMVIEQFEDV